MTPSLFRRVPDGSPNFGLEASKNDDCYQSYVNGITSDGSMIVRIPVQNNGSDLSYVQGILEGFNVTTVPRGGAFAATASTNGAEAASSIKSILSLSDTALTTLELLAVFNDRNQPFNTTAADNKYTQSQLKKAGINNGRYKKPLGEQHYLGELVTPGNTTSEDEMFQIVVQPYSNPLPSNWTNNWRPAPADTPFSVILRLYGPTEELRNRNREYPAIPKWDAILFIWCHPLILRMD
ncbi:hypothetical protein PISL3812_01634 [Talaromyces islandicus]|uniref:DUF1214 domain-containing protein n=1 Tax=Talaromyces islandicus TaxID=28573 RepID=A0A0U1LPD5_TALIS|nr:hypothetical protein PISL3812_01634 [Talaromyces islandicus]